MTSTALATTDRQALARRDPIGGLTVRFPADRYNVLAPVVHMDGGLPAGTRLVVTEVSVSPVTDPKGIGEDVIRIGGGSLLLRKHKLDQIANAVGISWIDEVRKDDRRHPHYVEAFVRGRLTDFDGTVREITGSKTIDLREDVGGLPGKDFDEIVSKNKDPGRQLMEARKFIAEIAFSKAKNRAISSAVGMKRSYTAQDLLKPFVVPKVALDTSDPQARELAMANAAGATAALYGSRARVIDAEVEEVRAAPAHEAEPSRDVGEPPAVEADPEPEHDQTTGEIKPEEVWRQAWASYCAAGGERETWTAFVRKAIGRAPSTPVTADEAGRVYLEATKMAAKLASEPGSNG